MKNIIAIKTIREYYEKRPDSKRSLLKWIDVAKGANWEKPLDVVDDFNDADPIKNSRVVFNISGNKHRLIVAINYHFKVVRVCFIGTHAEYDRVDATTVNLY